MPPDAVEEVINYVFFAYFIDEQLKLVFKNVEILAKLNTHHTFLITYFSDEQLHGGLFLLVEHADDGRMRFGSFVPHHFGRRFPRRVATNCRGLSPNLYLLDSHRFQSVFLGLCTQRGQTEFSRC